jgi:hypothetical protein
LLLEVRWRDQRPVLRIGPHLPSREC